MGGTTRFGAGRRLDAAAIRAASERNPRLRTFVSNLARHSEGGEAHARGLLERLIRRVVDDVGDVHMTHAITRLERIEVLRDNIAAILDHVLEGGELPPGVRPEDLGRTFDQLGQELHDLRRTQRALSGADESFKLVDDSLDYYRSVLADVDPVPGTHAEPVNALRDAVKALPQDQRGALRRAAELEPGTLVRALTSEERGQRLGVEELKAKLHDKLSAAELAELEKAIKAVGKERTTALQVSEPRLAEALARIPDARLRAAVTVGNDVWIVQQLALHNPQALGELWAAFRKRGGSDPGGFRAYVRHEMVTYGRGVVGEYTAAFSISSVDTLLKGPDTNVRTRGTDLVGITGDGWLWLIDDKSHRAASVDKVSSLTDNLVTNLRDDAAAVRGKLAELQQADPAFIPDPQVKDSPRRMEDAAAEIERIQAAGDPGTHPALISKALLDRKVKLRVTSAAGNVVELTQALKDLGLEIQPTKRKQP
ncbi:hypothetical protein OM076_11325 [Solirubrobacter ginsenosidimutans]|uniref:Uncharacterized protein n=1 Tax=Solirubrobacter ginsenosidimutans TaxID=490573 RepID=A0A9X3MR63_9ACTN|nr:hypothetical protein [Solirubrobacter ginsenosidimutans]MDA0160857.1 hypothetical protein [Solirubrobacter ginsenosidimutans]